MDDISSGGTVARSPKELVAFFYLNRLDSLLDAQRDFLLLPDNSGAIDRSLRSWASAAYSLFCLCRPRLAKKNPENAEIIERLISDGGFANLSKASTLLVDYLEVDLKLTDIAKVQDFDRTNIILSNKVKGFK